MFVRADEDLPVRDGRRSPRRLAKLVAVQDLQLLGVGPPHHRLPGLRGDVNLFAAQHRRAPGRPRRALPPGRLAGLELDALGDPRLVDQVEVVARDDAGADALWGLLLAPQAMRLGDVAALARRRQAQADGRALVP